MLWFDISTLSIEMVVMEILSSLFYSNQKLHFIKFQLVFDVGPDRGMRCDDALILKVGEWQGCRPTMPVAPYQGLMKWNE